MAKPWENDRVVEQEEAAAIVEQQAAAWEGDEEVVAPMGASGQSLTAAPQEDDKWGLFNRNIMDALMGPVDLANMPARAVNRGLDWLLGVENTPEREAALYTDPSDRAKNILVNTLGTSIAPDDAVPQTMGGRMAAGAGSALGSLPAIGVAGGAAAAYQGPGQAYINPVGQMMSGAMTSLPRAAQTAAWEGAAGAGMPVGGELGARLAEEHGLGQGAQDMSRAVGEVIGGFAPAGAAMGLGGAARLGGSYAENSPVLSPLVQVGKRLANPMDAAFTRASAAVRGRVSDPEALADTLNQDTLTQMTPGMRTGNLELMAHERSIIRTDPGLAERFAAREQEGMEDIRTYLSGLSEGATTQDARSVATEHVKRAQAAIDAELSNALRRADTAVRLAAPRGGLDQERLSQVFMDELENARTAARQIERDAWDAVPDDITTVPKTVRETYDQLVAERGVEGARSIDPYFKQIIDGEWKRDPVRSVQNLNVFRSEALRSAREARARGDNLTASISERMAAAAATDLEMVPAVNPALDTARAISRDYHDRFTKGEIGKLLQYEATGGSRVDPMQALRRIVGRGVTGERLTSNTEAVARAFNDPENPGIDVVSDYLRGDFTSALVNPMTGEYRPKNAEAWVNARTGFLDRYPELKRIVTRAVDATSAHTDASRLKVEQERALRDSPAAMFEASPVHREFDAILKARDPQQAMNEVMFAVNQVDRTGRAQLGLRQAATDYLFRRSEGIVASRGKVLRGTQFAEAVNDPRTRGALEVLYTPDQMSVLDNIASDLVRWDQMHNKVTNSSSPIVAPDIVDAVANNLAAFVGIKAGSAASRMVGAGSIQMPARGSKIATAIVDRLNASGAEKLLRDAVEDPALYQELLRGRRAPQTEGGHFLLDDNASPRLAGWLAAASSDLFIGGKEEPEDAWEDAISNIGGVLTR